MFYKVWSNYDANDCFEVVVVADNPADAALKVLSEMGWSVAAVGTEASEVE